MNEFSPLPDSPITLVRSNLVASNRYAEVFMDDVSFADGRKGTHLRIHEPGGGVVVLIEDEGGRIYLHKAYHYASNAFSLEIIRGYGESGESAKEAALRELSEEAAFKADTVSPPVLLGEVYPNSTILMSKVQVYLVTVQSPSPSLPASPEEGLKEGGWYCRGEVPSLIASGQITDSFTLSAWAMFAARRTFTETGGLPA